MRFLILGALGLALALALAAAGPALAQPGGTLDISAFADLVFPVSASDSTGTEFRVNQAELDLAGDIAPGVSAAMALAYDPTAETFALAVLEVRIPLAATEAFSATVGVGQFDVPFGIDYQVYASVDRRLVNGPLLLNCSHEGWNDLGVNLNLARGSWGADLFVINGNRCGRGVVDPVKAVDRREVKRAEGARLHLALGGRAELGASGALFHDQQDDLPMTLLGADFQLRWGSASFKGEYVAQTVDRGTPAEAANDGYYVQGLQEWARWYAVVRYGCWNNEVSGLPSPERLSLGAGWILREGLELRLEHDAGLQDLQDVTWLQMVLDFGTVGR